MVYLIDGFGLFQSLKEWKEVLNKIINNFHSFICSNTWEPALSLAQYRIGGIEMSKGHFSSLETVNRDNYEFVSLPG